MLNELWNRERLYPKALFEYINGSPRDLADQLIARIKMASIRPGFLLRTVTAYLAEVMTIRCYISFFNFQFPIVTTTIMLMYALTRTFMATTPFLAEKI